MGERFIRLEEDDELVLYKRGSRGEVVATYKTVLEFVEKERVYNTRFNPTSIYHSLRDKTRGFKSLHHQANVVARIRKTVLVN